MTRIARMRAGWTLYGDPATGNPWFKHRDGRWRTPFELSEKPEGREVFVAVERLLTFMDLDRERGITRELQYKACDRARLSMQLTLQMLARWADDLKERSDNVWRGQCNLEAPY